MGHLGYPASSQSCLTKHIAIRRYPSDDREKLRANGSSFGPSALSIDGKP